MTPKPRPRKPRDAATLKAVARDLKAEAKALKTLSRGPDGDRYHLQSRATELTNWANYYLEQARALEKRR